MVFNDDDVLVADDWNFQVLEGVANVNPTIFSKVEGVNVKRKMLSSL